MSLVKYNSILNDYTPTSFSSFFDKLFTDSMARTGGSTNSFVPRVDVLEGDKAYEIHIAVPGVSKDDFTVDLKDNLLTISGERKFKKEKTEKGFHSVETQYGAFSRSFTLPENVDGSGISAKYVNGILEITVPKDEKKALKTSIKVD